jgi:hypothetical protein
MRIVKCSQNGGRVLRGGYFTNPMLFWFTVIAKLHVIVHCKERRGNDIEIGARFVIVAVVALLHLLRRLDLKWLQLQRDDTWAGQAELPDHEANLLGELLNRSNAQSANTCAAGSDAPATAVLAVEDTVAEYQVGSNSQIGCSFMTVEDGLLGFLDIGVFVGMKSCRIAARLEYDVTKLNFTLPRHVEPMFNRPMACKFYYDT